MVKICTKTRAKAHAYRLADRHIQTLTYIQICCYSSAVLWVLWRLWRCEGKKALEAPTGLLPNGRVDIYPGRLWAVAAAPTEMIQPAIRNIGIYSDGWNSHGEGSGDVWGLCVYILSLNLPTHCIWHGCYLSHQGAMLTVILNSSWWRERNVSGITKWVSSITCFVESYMQAHNSSGRLNNENLKTNCLHTSFLYLSDLTESCSCSGSHVSARHKHLSLCVFTIWKFQWVLVCQSW